MHRAALAAHAQAEGRVEEQERREQGVKDEVPGIQVQSPQIHLFCRYFHCQAHRAALAAHALAEGRLAKEEKVPITTKPIKESVKKVSKIAATDKAAFKDILKAAVGKLLKNFGTKNSAGGKLKKKDSATYLDGLLTRLKSGEKVLNSAEKEESSSLQDLVRQLERRERGKDRSSLATRTLIASPESFLEKLLSKQARSRKRLMGSRRFNHRSRLDRLLASIHANDYDYDFNFDDDISLFESPRHSNYFDDDDLLFPSLNRGSASLEGALRSSQRLEDDLQYLLRKLERERN